METFEKDNTGTSTGHLSIGKSDLCGLNLVIDLLFQY